MYKLPDNIFAYSILPLKQNVTFLWMKEILQQFKIFNLYQGNLQGQKEEIYNKLFSLVKSWKNGTLKLQFNYKISKSQQIIINKKLAEKGKGVDVVELRFLTKK